jgi:ElaB/YqjD/DUF883 family membrane-anchored ribosome-binding protein
MTNTDKAADVRNGDAATKFPDAAADAVNDSLQGAKTVTDSTAREANRKIDSARAGVANSVEQAQKGVRAVRQHVREVNESSVDYIRQNPWRAVGISAGVGLLLGIIVGRR